MKKLIILSIILFSLNGFSQFGVKVNYTSYNLKASDRKVIASGEITVDGFGVGLDYSFELGKTTLILGLNSDFLSTNGDGGIGRTVITPSAEIRYPLGDTFGLRGGLALVNWSELHPFKASLLHFPIGLDVEIFEKISIIANYSIALGDRYKGEAYMRDNNINIGLHYKF